MVVTRNRTQTRFVVLPPARDFIPGIFRQVEVDGRRHEELFAGMQRFRGSVYHSDGAIEAHELTPDGRHNLSVDRHSWHVLSLDSDGRVAACLRYMSAKSWTRWRAATGSRGGGPGGGASLRFFPVVTARHWRR